MIDNRLFNMLACPACGMEIKEEGNKLTCVRCKIRFPVKNGMPIMMLRQSSRAGSLGEDRASAIS